MNLFNNPDLQNFTIEALKKDGNLIRYISCPCLELQKIAVESSLDSLKFINNPDKSIICFVVDEYEKSFKN